eukprot:jgi/Chrpa1/3620/Chrysochromulina_OHIO_Genome00016947-RA
MSLRSTLSFNRIKKAVKEVKGVNAFSSPTRKSETSSAGNSPGVDPSPTRLRTFVEGLEEETIGIESNQTDVIASPVTVIAKTAAPEVVQATPEVDAALAAAAKGFSAAEAEKAAITLQAAIRGKADRAKAAELQKAEDQLDSRAERELEKEMKEMRRKKEQAFAAEEAAQARAAYQEARAAEEKLEKVNEKAALEAKIAAMSEDELVRMQMTMKLSSDLETCAKSLALAAKAVVATELEIGTIQVGLKEDRATETHKVAEYDRNIKSINSMLKHVEAYDEQCSQLRYEVNQLVSMENQRRIDSYGITGRVRREVTEAQDRMAKQTDKLHIMQNELKKMYTQYTSAEKQSEAQFSTISSEVVGKTLRVELAEHRLSHLRAEQKKLNEQVAENTRFIDSKTRRVSSTTAQVEEIKAKMALDEQTIGGCKAREAELYAEDQLAEAQKEHKVREFDADRDSLRSLIALQESFRSDKLMRLDEELTSNPVLGDQGDPTKKTLLERARALVEKTLSDSKGRLALIEQAASTYMHKYDEAKGLRDSELRQLRAERRALVTVHAERNRYLHEKRNQLEIEEKQLARAEGTMLDHKYCMSVLQTEHDLLQKTINERQDELAAAYSLKQALGTKLESVQTSNMLNLGRMRMAIESESRVVTEQQAYIESLMGRMQHNEGTVIEENSTVKQQVAAMEKTGVEEAPVEPIQGNHGLALAHSNELAVHLLVDDLKAQRAQATQGLLASQEKLEAVEKAAQTALAAVDAERFTLQHEMSNLHQYRLSLESRLAAISPCPPSPPKITDVPASPNGDLIKPEADEHDHSPPSDRSTPTPYRTTNRLLVTSDKFSPPLSQSGNLTGALYGASLDDEANHSMYNPDIKVDDSPSSEKRTTIRSRIFGRSA